MRISKNRVLDFLTKCQIERGGYTGSNVAKLAKSLPLSPQALRKRIKYRQIPMKKISPNGNRQKRVVQIVERGVMEGKSFHYENLSTIKV